MLTPGSVAVLGLSAAALAAAFALAWTYRRLARGGGVRVHRVAHGPEGAASFIVLLALLAVFGSGARGAGLTQIVGSPSAERLLAWTAAAIAVASMLTVVRLHVVAPAVLSRRIRIVDWPSQLDEVRRYVLELSGVSAPLIALALFEEFVCRGLLIVLWRAAGQSPVVCLLVSTAVFGALHSGQGTRGVRFALFAGLAFGGLTLWTGAATAAMLAHVFYNTGVGAAAVWARAQVRRSARSASAATHPADGAARATRSRYDSQIPSVNLAQSAFAGALKNCAREH